MPPKKKTPPKAFPLTAAVGLTNEKTGQRYEAGAGVPADAFPAEVVESWLARGILTPNSPDDPGEKEA